MTEKKMYSRKDIEDMIWLPCCHVSGMHNPCHFTERTYICGDFQIRDAFLRLCKILKLNPVVRSLKDCCWCNEYPEYKKGEGLKLRDNKWMRKKIREVELE